MSPTRVETHVTAARYAPLMTWDPLEADTCRDLVLPALKAAGWTTEQIVMEYPLQNPDAEHVQVATRGRPRRADYALEINGVPVAVVEAKRERLAPADGIQQAIDYAVRLDVPYAISTNGQGIVLHDRILGRESEVLQYPTPTEAWDAYSAWLAAEDGSLSAETVATLRVPFDRTLRAHGGASVKVPRYYQRRAVHSVIRAVGQDRKRVLLLMATGTGKTFTALQLVHKLRARAAAARGGRPYRVLYLADRDILVATPQNDFRQAFGDAVVRLTSTSLTRSRDVYFATYQALDRDAPDDVPSPEESTSPSLFHALPADFFDLVVVDECHRGSSTPGSSWRAILEHFASAVHVGLTATPKRDVNVDTYDYFGEPVFTYSLRDGIEDGYLAPYRVRRVVLDIDAEGWSPAPGQVDRFGAEIPDGTYTTPDFERRLVVPERTAVMARHLVSVLADDRDRDARAVVFCVNREHAQVMRQALLAADPDRTRRDPSWAVRIVGGESEKDRLLAEFTEPDRASPAVATTSRLLSTGVDIEDLRYVVLCRPVGSMIEFKQIVGRGTRLFPPKGKQDFWVVDYVGASVNFSDVAFDGPPLAPPRRERLHDDGHVEQLGRSVDEAPVSSDHGAAGFPAEDLAEFLVDVAEPDADFSTVASGDLLAPRKLYVDGVAVVVHGESVYVRDPHSGTLGMVEYSSYAREVVRTLYPTLDDLRRGWSREERRAEVVRELGRHGLLFDELESRTGLVEADPFDLLAHVAWDMPPLSRRQRANNARAAHSAQIDALSAGARAVVETLLENYAERGIDEVSREALRVPPLDAQGTPHEIVGRFGGPGTFRAWLDDLQDWLYETSY